MNRWTQLTLTRRGPPCGNTRLACAPTGAGGLPCLLNALASAHAWRARDQLRAPLRIDATGPSPRRASQTGPAATTGLAPSAVSITALASAFNSPSEPVSAVRNPGLVVPDQPPRDRAELAREQGPHA